MSYLLSLAGDIHANTHSVTSAALFILLVVPFTRRLLGHLLSVQPARRQPGTSVREKRGAAAVAVHHQQQQAAAAAAAAQLNNASKQQQAMQMQLQAASLRAAEATPDTSTDGRRVRLKDAGQVFCMIHTANEMAWPSAALKAQSGQPAWGEWRPYTGVEGRICHYWLGNAEKARATGQGLARRSCLAYDLVVVRVQDADQQKTFVASLEGLEPADAVKVCLSCLYFLCSSPPLLTSRSLVCGVAFESSPTTTTTQDDIVLPRDGDTVVYPITGPKAGIL